MKLYDRHALLKTSSDLANLHRWSAAVLRHRHIVMPYKLIVYCNFVSLHTPCLPIFNRSLFPTAVLFHYLFFSSWHDSSVSPSIHSALRPRTFHGLSIEIVGSEGPKCLAKISVIIVYTYYPIGSCTAFRAWLYRCVTLERRYRRG
ncbi:hypothetical protein HZ326_14032 [Fusarium oxysporum f. sp. albedinis]|nr:hypothetical protein HZ326_14032 [Fusarium oxysporum f. sp. albedinis]